MPERRKDWEVGIEPTLEETIAAAKRARARVEEANEILDELFGPDPLPYRKLPRDYSGQRRQW